jgi:hypothetical protein
MSLIFLPALCASFQHRITQLSHAIILSTDTTIPDQEFISACDPEKLSLPRRMLLAPVKQPTLAYSRN